SSCQAPSDVAVGTALSIRSARSTGVNGVNGAIPAAGNGAPAQRSTTTGTAITLLKMAPK
ncbi:MAG: hypothetical protein RIR77_1280, partial [Planctomycetota bacterium]